MLTRAPQLRPNTITVLCVDWEFDQATGDWTTGPMAYNVYGSPAHGWHVRLPGKTHPRYDTLEEAMRWSVWHMASSVAEAMGMIEAYETAKCVWNECRRIEALKPVEPKKPWVYL